VIAQPLRWRLCQENTAQKLGCAPIGENACAIAVTEAFQPGPTEGPQALEERLGG